MVIGSLNIQNKFYIRHYNGVSKEYDYPKLLQQLLDTYQLNCLGTQELVRPYLENLNLSSYQIIGDFRLPNHFFSKYNESNSIITKEEVLTVTTKRLPIFPSIIPRIITIATLKTKEFGHICMMNTHLSLYHKGIQRRQLQKIIHFIQNSAFPVILTGDFNMTIHNPQLQEFITTLASLGLKRVPIFEKTYKKHRHNLAIDHIFIPQSFIIDEIAVIKDPTLATFSDHYPILVTVKKDGLKKDV